MIFAATVPSVIVNTAFPLSWATGADGLLGAIFGSMTGVPSSTGSLISKLRDLYSPCESTCIYTRRNPAYKRKGLETYCNLQVPRRVFLPVQLVRRQQVLVRLHPTVRLRHRAGFRPRVKRPRVVRLRPTVRLR